MVDTPFDAVDPHASSGTLSAGLAPEDSAGVLLLVHGRGATAQSILGLYDVMGVEQLSAIAPQAYNDTWYPHSFLAPIESNQPYLDSALRRLEQIVQRLLGSGLKSQRIALLGFSQGACLCLEFAARHPRRYGAVLGLSGGLVGPPGAPLHHTGALDGTPVFLGGADPDPHVPFERVEQTAAVLRKMGAQVDLRRYPGMGHTITQEELDICRTMLEQMLSTPTR